MKCLFECGLEHGYSEPCANPKSPYYDSALVVPDEAEVIEKVLTQVERNRSWRERNPEKYLAQQRRYIEKRAKEKKDG